MRRSPDPSHFVQSFTGRIQALASAHDLLVEGKMKAAEVSRLIREQALLRGSNDPRVTMTGAKVMLDARAAVQLALVIHELATNARKYGALASPDGRLSIQWSVFEASPRSLTVEWREAGVRDMKVPGAPGFGTTLIERSLQSAGGTVTLRYGADSVTCVIKMPLFELEEVEPGMEPLRQRWSLKGSVENFRARGPQRILIVEDEALVSLEMEDHLRSAGYEIVGPAASRNAALQLVAEADFDLALLDANLGGEPVDDIASALYARGAPFAFSTGYGPAGLPAAFRQWPVLSKPFNKSGLFAVVAALGDELTSENVGCLTVSTPQAV